MKFLQLRLQTFNIQQSNLRKPSLVLIIGRVKMQLAIDR